jgi:uncharacterized membrane protein
MKSIINDCDTQIARNWILIASLVIIVGIFISTFKLFTPYSYWVDELYSVNASSNDWSGLHKFLLSDVHPPLYQVILKLWMSIFNDAEPATRSLSWCFMMGSFFLALRFASRQGCVFFYTVTVCYISNWLVIFYANETRSYAMALFLSTLLLTLFPFSRNEGASNRFYMTAIILSLTHYFGLILAGISLIVVLFFYAKNLAMITKTVVTGLICLIWPLHHIFNGSIASHTGGNFWIKVEGPFQTLKIASSSMIPGLGKVGAALFITCLIMGAIICFTNKKSVLEKHNVAKVGIVSAIFVLSMVSLVAIIDSYAPISTHRNYIVIIPSLVFLFGAAAQLIAKKSNKRKSIVLALVTLYSCLILYASYNQIINKSQNGQDWRGAIEIAASEAPSRKPYYNTFDGIVDYYFLKNNISPGALMKYTPRETILIGPSVIVYGHLSADKFSELQKEMDLLGARQIFPGENYREKTTPGGLPGVYVID